MAQWARRAPPYLDHQLPQVVEHLRGVLREHHFKGQHVGADDAAGRDWLRLVVLTVMGPPGVGACEWRHRESRWVQEGGAQWAGCRGETPLWTFSCTLLNSINKPSTAAGKHAATQFFRPPCPPRPVCRLLRCLGTRAGTRAPEPAPLGSCCGGPGAPGSGCVPAPASRGDPGRKNVDRAPVRKGPCRRAGTFQGPWLVLATPTDHRF